MQESNERFLHLKHISVIHYLPTLALSKSGSGLKLSLTLSLLMQAPRFSFLQQFYYTPLLLKYKFLIPFFVSIKTAGATDVIICRTCHLSLSFLFCYNNAFANHFFSSAFQFFCHISTDAI